MRATQPLLRVEEADRWPMPLRLAPPAAINAERAGARGDHDEARRQLARWSWGYSLIVLLLIAGAWDMVFKPGL